MKEIIKFKRDDILNKNFSIPGTFLYEKDEELYFNNGFNNILSLSTDGENEIDYYRCFEKNYLEKLFWAVGNCDNKPTILCFNDYLSKFESLDLLLGSEYYNLNLDIEDKVSFEFEIEKLNNSPCIFHNGNEEDFDKVLDAIIAYRNPIVNNMGKDFNAYEKLKDIIVLISDPQELDIEKIKTMMTIGLSRKIYFLISIMDKQKFIENTSEVDYDIVEGLCKSKMVYSSENKNFNVIPNIKNSQV